MLAWLGENWITVVAIAAVALVVGLAIFSLHRDRKKGASSCGGKCSSCPYGGSCGKH